MKYRIDVRAEPDSNYPDQPGDTYDITFNDRRDPLLVFTNRWSSRDECWAGGTWHLFYVDPDSKNEAIESYELAGRSIEDVDWAIQQAQSYLEMIDYPPNGATSDG